MILSATLLTRSTVHLTWRTENPHQGFDVQRALPKEQPELIATVRDRIFIDGTVKAGTTYAYRVSTNGAASPEAATLAVVTAPELEYATAKDFYNSFLSPTFRRDHAHPDRVRWCKEWWKHGEALFVVIELWNSWEAMRPPPPPAPPGVDRAVWFRDYATPLLQGLWDPCGTFSGCCHDEEHNDSLKEYVPLPPRP